MLILHANQVEYCRVARQAGPKTELLPGVAYRQRLFVKGETYTPDRRKQAILDCRQRFAEKQGLVYILLIVGEEEIALWYQDDTVERYPES